MGCYNISFQKLTVFLHTKVYFWPYQRKNTLLCIPFFLFVSSILSYFVGKKQSNIMQNEQNNFRYVDLSWAVVGIGENEKLPTEKYFDGFDEPEAVERYVVGYLTFWNIARVDLSLAVPCHDEQLRQAARRKIARHIAEHPPMEPLPRFYFVLLGHPESMMEEDGMSHVFQV